MLKYYKEVKDAFNEWSETYEQDVIPKLKARGYSYNELGALIANYINSIQKENVTVLELGVGTGILGINVIKHVEKQIELIGVDISDYMLNKAQEKQIYNSLICCSADEFEFSQRVNLIFSGFMFHSVKEQELLLKNVYNLIENDGIFILIDLIPNLSICDKDSDYVEHSKQYEHGAPSNYKTNKELIDMLNKSKFELTHIESLGINKDYNHYMYVLQKTEA